MLTKHIYGKCCKSIKKIVIFVVTSILYIILVIFVVTSILYIICCFV